MPDDVNLSAVSCEDLVNSRIVPCDVIPLAKPRLMLSVEESRSHKLLLLLYTSDGRPSLH
ncbi:hypothetical protein DFO47_11293 [Arthrobacter sp. AG258]|nr:hypothetical protein DFO47_11293 [Arthrobacter sp. AG258]